MKAGRPLNYPLLSLLIALFFIAINLVCRPIVPIDETRYVSVAWEMWSGDSWLVPLINGMPYAHKPPLLFWLLGGVWSLFGTSDMVTRAAVPLFALGNLYLVRKLAQKVYPQHRQVAELAPIILIGLLGWFLYSGAIMFDLLLSVFVLSSVLSLWNYAETAKRRWILWAGLALGLGMLTKGPVVFVYLVPFIALVRLWNPGTSVTNWGVIKAGSVAGMVGIAIILSWAVPAALAGGPDYAKAIFWEQSAGRIQDSFAHARPIYWYVMLLPVLVFPWLFLCGFWRSKPWQDVQAGDRLCLGVFVVVLGLFSCFSGKQIHYLFPSFPFLAIWIGAKIKLDRFKAEPFVALFVFVIAIAIFSAPLWIDRAFRQLDEIDVWIWWGLLPLIVGAILIWPKALAGYRFAFTMAAVPLSLSALLVSISPILDQVYDVTPMAQQIHDLQVQGYEVAYPGKYHDTFGFAGKLTLSLASAPRRTGELLDYLKHKRGYTVWGQKNPSDDLREAALMSSPYRTGRLYIVENRELYRILSDNEGR